MDRDRKTQLLEHARQFGRDGKEERELRRLCFRDLKLTRDEIEEVAEEAQREFQQGCTERKAQLWPIWYTTAPVAYDGFGTAELAPCVARSRQKPVRKVAIHPDYVRWQTGRYASGVEMVADGTEFEKLCGYGLLQLCVPEPAV